ncbi:MAG: response regulator, partial [Phycisphaerae bacterium]
MPQSLRVLVFNADESFASDLRRVLLHVPGLKIVAEIDEASLLPQAITRFPADLIFVNLDPDIGVVLEVMRQILENHARLPVFALSSSTEGDVVLQAMRAGFREFLVKPLAKEEFNRALAKLEIDATAEKDPGKLIAVMGCSGGVGVSVVATNLAVELAVLVGEPRRVALVDLDFRFGHIATMLDLHPQFTVAELCESPEHVDPTMIDKATVDHDSGVRVLARPNDFAQAEMVTAAHCITILSALADVCDYVVVDGPTRYDPAGQSVIDAADYNLLVMQLLVTSVRNADRIFRELGQQGFNLDRIQL